MIISIFASIGAHNLGDELILKNEIKLLEEKHGADTQFIVFTYDLNDRFYDAKNIIYKEYFPINFKKNILRNIKNYFSFISAVIKSDLIVIGGGGIFYDNEVQSVSGPLNQWIFRTKVFVFFGKQVEFFRVGLNIKSKSNYKKIKEIFSIKSKIRVRDQYSFELLQSLGIKSKIDFDPVYSEYLPEKFGKSLVNIQAKSFDLKVFEKLDVSGKKVGIALRSGYIKDEDKQVKKLIKLLENNGAKIILVPHSFHKLDSSANDYLFLKQFSTRGSKITKNLQESYDIYRKNKIDICIAMRLHSMILSEVYGIDYVGVSYSEKTKQLLALKK